MSNDKNFVEKRYREFIHKLRKSKVDPPWRIRETSEYAEKDDTNQLPNLANGQAIICGQIVNFSLPVQIQFDEELLNENIGNEDFISAVDKWDDKESVKQRKNFAKAFSKISQIDTRRPH